LSLRLIPRVPRADLITLGVQGVVIDKTSRILLVRHGYRPGWHFPGGGVERGEKIDHALCRELNEETGVIPTAPARLVAIYTNFDIFPGDHVVLFFIDQWRQDHIPAPNAEILEQRFFALDRLPKTTTTATKRRLGELFAGATRETTW
jgi:ADP-ribose pyrophosphatase YjhB (NUDIX family)